MEVSVQAIQTLLEAVNKVPEMTPKCWELISELVQVVNVCETGNLRVQLFGDTEACSIDVLMGPQNIAKIFTRYLKVQIASIIINAYKGNFIVCATSDTPG